MHNVYGTDRLNDRDQVVVLQKQCTRSIYTYTNTFILLLSNIITLYFDCGQ
jgi:hypothetical protein